jgi:hypothetical protein
MSLGQCTTFFPIAVCLSSYGSRVYIGVINFNPFEEKPTYSSLPRLELKATIKTQHADEVYKLKLRKRINRTITVTVTAFFRRELGTAPASLPRVHAVSPSHLRY